MKERRPSFEIRTVEPGDLASLRALYHAVIDEDAGFRRAPGEYGDEGLESFAEATLGILDTPQNAYLVAVLVDHGSTSVIGFVRFRQNVSRSRTRHTGSLTIAVQREHRARGVGQALLDALLDRLQGGPIERVSLQVFEDNPPARRFYERNGFEVSGILPKEIRMEEGRYRHLILMHRWIG